jgi:hypothetical protein
MQGPASTRGGGGYKSAGNNGSLNFFTVFESHKIQKQAANSVVLGQQQTRYSIFDFTMTETLKPTTTAVGKLEEEIKKEYETYEGSCQYV